jgi:hypothetical protein
VENYLNFLLDRYLALEKEKKQAWLNYNHAGKDIKLIQDSYILWASDLHCQFASSVWDLPEIKVDLFNSTYEERSLLIIDNLILMGGMRLALILDQIL